MKKIIVIGCPGAGKSTFSRALRDKMGMPLYYLDMLWHKEDRTNISREEFDLALCEIMKGESWIIDGNYNRTLKRRLEHCDTVFLLDYPLDVCMSGIEARVGTKREDMPWIEHEVDAEFREFIESFSEQSLPKIYSLLEEYADCVNVVVFKSREEAKKYLEAIIPKE